MSKIDNLLPDYINIDDEEAIESYNHFISVNMIYCRSFI